MNNDVNPNENLEQQPTVVPSSTEVAPVIDNLSAEQGVVSPSVEGVPVTNDDTSEAAITASSTEVVPVINASTEQSFVSPPAEVVPVTNTVSVEPAIVSSTTEVTPVTNADSLEQSVGQEPSVSSILQEGDVQVTPVSESEQPVQPTGPVPPQQQRVSLFDDKPAIQAIMPNSDVAVKQVSETATSVVSEDTEILDVVELPKEDSIAATAAVEPDTGNKSNKLQTFFLFALFGGLLVLIIFLPDISSYIETQKYLNSQPVEKITNGTLKCSYESSSDTLDYTYSLDFRFTDSKLTKLTYVLETRGDANLDEATLNGLKAECDQLDANSENLSGVSVSCDLSNGLLTQRQVLNYSSIDVDDAITAYTEAGGVYPDYENNESIDSIEKEMNASGYTCERIK